MSALIFIVFLLVFCTSFCAWLLFRRRIHIHTSPNTVLVSAFPLEHKKVAFATDDGEIIAGWYRAQPKARAVVILIPGFSAKNGGKALMLPHADYLVKNGYSVLLLDLRATGESSGNKIFLGTKEWKDVLAAYTYIATQPENKNKKIGYLGISMGAATAIITLGMTQKGDFAIASVPFSSFDRQLTYELQKMSTFFYLFIPIFKIIARLELGWNYNKYDPIKMIRKIHIPFLIFSAKHDVSVEYLQAKELYENANDPKEFWLADTGHDIFDAAPNMFKKKVLDFLERTCS